MLTARIQLQRHMLDLRDKVHALRTTVLQDRPPGDFALEDVFSDEEVIFQVDDLNHRVARYSQQVQPHSARLLAECDDQFSRLANHLRHDWLSYARVIPLIMYAGDYGDDGQRWWEAAQAGMDELSDCFFKVRQAVLQCWIASVVLGEESVTTIPTGDCE